MRDVRLESVFSLGASRSRSGACGADSEEDGLAEISEEKVREWKGGGASSGRPVRYDGSISSSEGSYGGLLVG